MQVQNDWIFFSVLGSRDYLTLTSELAEYGDVTAIQSSNVVLEESRWLHFLYRIQKYEWDVYTYLVIQRIEADDWHRELGVIEEGETGWTAYQVCLPSGNYSLAFRAVIGVPGFSKINLDSIRMGGACRDPENDTESTQGR